MKKILMIIFLVCAVGTVPAKGTLDIDIAKLTYEEMQKIESVVKLIKKALQDQANLKVQIYSGYRLLLCLNYPTDTPDVFINLGEGKHLFSYLTYLLILDVGFEFVDPIEDIDKFCTAMKTDQ